MHGTMNIKFTEFRVFLIDCFNLDYLILFLVVSKLCSNNSDGME